MRRIECIGNLGKDAEFKVLTSGTEVCNFDVATKSAKKDGATIWVRCALFGKRADALWQYLVKGKRVFVRGPLEVSQWESNGKGGVNVDLTVDEIELLDGGEKKDGVTPPRDW